MLGNPTKAKTFLGWDPHETSFDKLVGLMVKFDLEIAKHEVNLKSPMTSIRKDSKIFIAGKNGMVGSACWRIFLQITAIII